MEEPDDDRFYGEDDDDVEEAVFLVPSGLLAGGGDDSAHMVNNVDDWHDGAYPFTWSDVAVTALGLAANLSGAVSIFFRDLRHDMCAARNHGSRRRQVAEFDADVAALPTAVTPTSD